MNPIKTDWKDLLRLLLDLAVFVVSYTGAFLLRFDAGIPPEYLAIMLLSLPGVVAIRTLGFWYFGLFRGVWRYVSVIDILSLMKAVAASTCVIVGGIYFSQQFPVFPRSVFVVDAALTILLSSSIRLVRRVISCGLLPFRDSTRRRVLIVGGGDAGEALLRDIERARDGRYLAVAIADDNPGTQGKRIHTIPVAGGINDIPRLVEQEDIDEIFIAIPSATSDEMKRIVQSCREARRAFRTMPALGENHLNGTHLDRLQEVRLEDLFSRPSVALDLSEVERAMAGKRVLVTGAGGSIGSELCHRVLKFNPEQVILLEKSENALFYLHRSLSDALGRQAPDYGMPGSPLPSADRRLTTIVPILADVTNRPHVDYVIKEHRPHFVFHAAAHKHVPLTEISPCEAVRNNLGGMKNLVMACGEHGVDTLVLLSTDKAANPINILGITKRIAEEYVAAAASHYGARFMSVRFGNVLESTGSVVRVFREQLRKGKPLTVTHPEVKRYFMSKGEAVQLVLQAAVLGQGGNILVLAMGEPVPIVEVARELSFLTGFAPANEANITFVGLRPGEKLVEELIGRHEEWGPTSHPKILALKTYPPEWSTVNQDVGELEKLAEAMDWQGLQAHLHAWAGSESSRG